MAKEKAEFEAKHSQMQIQEQPETVEPEKVVVSDENAKRQWIGFLALLSVDEAKALGAWLKANNIKYKAIK